MNISLTTLGDLSDEENIKTCDYERQRSRPCDWMARWGDAVVARLHDVVGFEEDDHDALKEAEKDANEAEEALGKITDAAQALIKALDDIDLHSEKLDAAIAALENEL